MVMRPEQGMLVVLAVNAVPCIAGLCLLWVFFPQLVANYIAYGVASSLCMYLISRYIVGSVDYLYENRIMASRSSYVAAGTLTSAFSAFGIFRTLATGQIDGMMYISFVALGANFGEYRKMRLRKHK
jgi:hypothetical protein